ncbi:MAG: PHP domain-containing protein [Lachnospiraceae bacterium]|nr:PHP domain-containing protein [Lachnospiraceae bacterium]
MMPLSYDLHIHSCLSPCGDDDMTPSNIVGMAKILGLDVVAITDHNSCKNCPSFAAAAHEYGILPIFGMELTTSEEVHVLCLFDNLEAALEYDKYVFDRIPDIPNNTEYFGNQLLYDTNDKNCGYVEKLLISATDISFDDVYDLLEKYDGVMIPAHINKPTTSLISNLGFIPPDSKFKTVEIQAKDDKGELIKAFPYLNDCRFIKDSDAHALHIINEAINFMHPEECDAKSILKYLKNT